MSLERVKDSVRLNWDLMLWELGCFMILSFCTGGDWRVLVAGGAIGLLSTEMVHRKWNREKDARS